MKARKTRTLSLAIIPLLCLYPQENTKSEKTKSYSLSVTDGLHVHLDASKLDLDNQAKVSELKNLASPSLEGVSDAIQSDVSRQPTYIKESNISGLPALRFTSDTMMQIGSDSGFYLNDMTIFAVVNPEKLNDHGEILSRVATTSPWNHNWFMNIENTQFNYGWSVGSNGSYSYPQNKASIKENTNYVLAGRKSGNNGDLIVNGSYLGSFIGGDCENPEDMKVTLGALARNDSFLGDIGEILVYSRGLEDNEIREVEQYLEGKWKMENIHDGTLADLSVKDKTITGFRSERYDYSLVLDEALKAEDISYKLYNTTDQVELTEEKNRYILKVTSGGQTTTYTISYETADYEYNEIETPSYKEVQLNDGFWKDRYDQYATYTVNYMFDMFDKSKSFDNFDRVANGEKKILGNTSEHAAQILSPRNDRDVYNTEWNWVNEPWREGLIYEGIRAASQFMMASSSNSSYSEENEKLRKRVSDYVERIYQASLKTTWNDANGKPVDGYFSTFTVLDRTKVCDETDVSARYHHDVYNFGCLAEAAVYHYQATGDTRLLFAATRFAEFFIDYINGRDGYKGYKVIPAHELPEEALQSLYDLYSSNPDLVKLMEATYSKVNGLSVKDRYYDLKIRFEEYKKIASNWISERGNPIGRYQTTTYGTYAQDNTTVENLNEAIGHAVRANLYYNGMAYIANRQDNDTYRDAAYRIYENIVNTQMAVTGGTGSTNDGDEAYGGSYQIPHNGYNETCASSGMAFFSQNMFKLFGKAKYADTVELEMYNGILGCLGLGGDSFYYTNPLVSNNYTRPMFSNATPCCVPMYLKFYSQIQKTIYAKNDDTVFVNQFISSSYQSEDNDFTLIQNTELPNGNKASFSFDSTKDMKLKVRMPSWASRSKVTVDGNVANDTLEDDGYLTLSMSKGKHRIQIEFDKEVMFLSQDYAKDNVGKTALQYGPFVYCLEECDNEYGIRLDTCKIDTEKDVSIISDTSTFSLKYSGKTTVISTDFLSAKGYMQNRETDLTFVPYAYRGNRDAGYMKVWVDKK